MLSEGFRLRGADSSEAKSPTVPERIAQINYRVLGRTGLKTSEVGFGAWAIGGNDFGNSYGPTDDSASLAAIKTAIEKSRLIKCKPRHFR